jgi:PAS domain S-box-containing protein
VSASRRGPGAVPDDSERVLLVAPTSGDARVSEAVLREAGLTCRACADVAELCAAAEYGVGTVLLTQEVIAAGPEPLVALLARQQPWSDLPIILLVDDGAEAPLAAWAMENLGSVTVLERPVRVTTLVSALRTALRARRHQYELRDRFAASSLLAAMVQGSDDAILSYALDGAVLSWNAGAERLFGWPADDMVGRSVDTLVPPDRRDEASRVRERLRAGERVAPFETVRITREGRRVDLSITVSAIRDAVGRIVGISKVARDVGARLRAEEAARTAEGQLALITDNLPPLISYIGRDLRYRLNNRAYETWFGLERAQIHGRQVQEVLGREAWERLRPYMESALAGTRVQFEAEIPYAHGGVRWIDASYVPDVADDGEVRGFAVLINDVSARRRAENALRESEARFRLMADAAPVLIWLSDTEGRRTWFNRPWLEFTGRGLAEELGDAWTAGVHLDDVEQVRESFRASFTARLGVRREFRLRRADGAYRWLLETAQPMLHADGSFLGYIGSCTDVTEWHEAQEVLLQSDRRKDEFLATLGHELRNPLAPIRNSLHILRLTERDAGSQRRLVDMMERQVDQLVRLVDDLLEVSRISRGKITLRTEPVELGQVLRSAAEACRPLMEREGHDFQVQLPQEPITLEGDAVRLTQVVANLLNNSAKYTEAGGRVWLGAARVGGEAVITVRDTGLGIPAEMLPHIFDMFAQVNRTLGRAQGGLGIGLALVRRLVELHGGRVEARSAGEGTGSEFVVRLPMAAPRPPDGERGRPSETPARAGARRVLVVDDNRDAAESLARLLRLRGHEVRVAHDGVQAMALATALQPELILLDLGMPGLDGFEVARRLRREAALGHPLLVALTGYGQEDDRRRTAEAGFDGHFVKPLDLAALERLLAREDAAHAAPT